MYVCSYVVKIVELENLWRYCWNDIFLNYKDIFHLCIFIHKRIYKLCIIRNNLAFFCEQRIILI